MLLCIMLIIAVILGGIVIWVKRGQDSTVESQPSLPTSTCTQTAVPSVKELQKLSECESSKPPPPPYEAESPSYESVLADCNN